jgi:hypothetical protein
MWLAICTQSSVDVSDSGYTHTDHNECRGSESGHIAAQAAPQLSEHRMGQDRADIGALAQQSVIGSDEFGDPSFRSALAKASSQEVSPQNALRRDPVRDGDMREVCDDGARLPLS